MKSKGMYHRKRGLVMILVVVAMLCFFAYSSFAYYTNITYSCPDDICVVDELIQWKVGIVGGTEYVTIEMIDKFNGSVLGAMKRTFNPLSSNRGNPVKLNSRTTGLVTFNGTVPEPDYEGVALYYPCFTTTIEDTYVIARDGTYTQRFCYDSLNLTIDVVDCTRSTHCEEDEYCSNNKCVRLGCRDCQFIANHSCTNYECCSHDACSFNAVCVNNTCETFSCDENEQFFNHTCVPLGCLANETFMNNTCQPLNCDENEGFANHSCVPLSCEEHEFVENHACVPLNCAEDEKAESHTCVALSCKQNERVFNHECIPLSCWFFQDAYGHSCVTNKVLVFKGFLELLALIVIIILMGIDFKTIREHLPKNNKRGRLFFRRRKFF